MFVQTENHNRNWTPNSTYNFAPKRASSNRLLKLLLSVCVVVLTAGAAVADTVTITGTTVGGATFNRPEPNSDNTVTSLSLIGTNTAYRVFGFSVSQSGTYNFISTQTGFDGVLLLYQTNFNPLAPLTNIVIGNDDFNAFRTSGFNQTLSVSVNYFLVIAGYQNSDAGSFTNTISGAGIITQLPTAAAIPEPFSLTLLATGLTGVWVKLRRRYHGHTV